MKIAFLSYEYPPETGGGGIGTYLAQLVNFMPKFGHKVVVFCGTNQKEAFWENESVYRIPCKSISDYNHNLMSFFVPIHTQINFDICEGTDFGACGIEILRQMPQIPFVTRAHTANFIIDQFLFQPLKGWSKWRFILGGLKRFEIPKLPLSPIESDFLLEKEIVKTCDRVVSLSHSLAKFYLDLNWCSSYDHLPSLFEIKPEILKIEQNNKPNDALNIVFYGRLEIRKGVLEIGEAIPKILKKYPKTIFYLIGKSANSPKSGVDMKKFLQNKLTKYQSNIIFQEAFQPSEIVNILSMGDIFLIPSRYDNSPLVCYETMAAGKPVIATNNGGMAELIENNISGFLIDPNNVDQLVEKTLKMIESPNLRSNFGICARKKIIENFTAEKIINQQINIFNNVIKNKIKTT